MNIRPNRKMIIAKPLRRFARYSFVSVFMSTKNLIALPIIGKTQKIVNSHTIRNASTVMNENSINLSLKRIF
jgi:hypothetical protein